MVISRRSFLLASAALLGTSRAVAAATGTNILDLRVEYAAASLIGAGERAAPGRLWRTRAALRHEGTQQGRALTIIARLDRNLGWLVMAEPRLAIETDLSALDLPLDVLKGGDGLRQSGFLLGAEALEPVETAATVRIRNGRMSITDGPFAETKEQLAGFYLIEARDLNAAIQVAARIPPAREGSIEVRPVRQLDPEKFV